MRVLACASLTVATLLARPTLARACSCNLEISHMPDYGSVDVPTNTKIWLDGGGHCRGSAELAPRLLDPDGLEIPFTSTCLLSDTGFHYVRVLHPNEPLLPNTTYTVEPESGLEYTFPFTTGAGPDHTPPTIPEEVDRTVEHADPGLCSETGTHVATLTVAGEAALFVLHTGDSSDFDATTVAGQVAELSQDDSLLLGRSACHGDNFPGGASRGVETTIRYGALDLAGNFSGWSAPSALSLGDELPTRGCSVLTRSPPAWWLVLAPLFARRRRR